MTLATASVAGATDVWVGDRDLSATKLKQLTQKVGQMGAQNRDGFYALKLRKGVSLAQAKKSLKDVDFVLPKGSENIDESHLPSVRNHIAYMRAKFKLNGQEEGKGESGVDFYEALEHYLEMRVGPNGRIDRAALDRAIQQRDQLPTAPYPKGDARAPGGLWVHVGPKNNSVPYTQYMGPGPISGRKNCIAVSKTTPTTMYVASAGGGVWKTVNGGTTWSPLSDKWTYLHTSSVAVDPTNANVVYVGTGDYVGFFQRQSFGMLKSINGGTSWTNINHPDFAWVTVNRIIVHPTNPQTVIVTTGKGDLPGGIYRSINGGTTWTKVNPANTDGDYDDLEVAPDGSLYAVATTGGNSKGRILKSTNQGASWVNVNNPSVANNPALEIAVSKVSSTTLYLLATGDKRIYKSLNGGSTWSNITGNFPVDSQPGDGYNWSQKDYDYHISTGKSGATDLVFVGLITVAMSRGGNTTWVDIGRAYTTTTNNTHSDQHSFAAHPTDPNTYYFGNDGGIYRYTYAATGTGTFASLNSTIYDHQLYHMSVKDDTTMMGGTQDNASHGSRGNLASWLGLYAGDGGWSGFDSAAGGKHFVTSQNASVWHYTTATDTTPDYVGLQGQSVGFISPVIYAGTGSQIFVGGQRLWRWNGTPNSWTGLVNLSVQGKANVLEAAPSNKTIMYSGSNQGEVLRITSSGAAATQIDNASIDRPVGAISINNTNTNEVLVGLQGSPNGNARLWRCLNTAAAIPTWTSMSGTGAGALPDVPINAIARDPHSTTTFYVGTDIGAFMTTNTGVTWTNMNALGLPNVHVNRLTVNPAKTFMYAGTFGRGIWRIPLVTTLAPFTISGNVKRAAGTNYAGVTITANKLRNLTTAVNSTPNVNIPDANLNGVVIPLNVAANQQITRIDCTLDILHPFAQDLQVILYHPDNTGVYLWNQEIGINIVGTAAVRTFNGKRSNGQWKLWVIDSFAGDTGTVRRFNLTIYYDGYSVAKTITTDVNGNYTLTGLDAGQYQVRASRSGSTFTPSLLNVILGPSKSAQNFTSNN